MQLLPAIRRKWDSVAWQYYRFRIPDRTLPAVRIRSLDEKDVTACHEIYRLNEPERFPPNYFNHFNDLLTGGRALFVVVEEDQKILGLGGVILHPVASRYTVSLCFGMVLPKAQGRGLGTVLLLARLALLPEPGRDYTLSLSPLAGSQTFYRKFGFGFVRSFKDYKSGILFDSFGVIIRRSGLHRCREKLAASDVTVESYRAVPVVPIKKADDGTYRMV